MKNKKYITIVSAISICILIGLGLFIQAKQKTEFNNEQNTTIQNGTNNKPSEDGELIGFENTSPLLAETVWEWKYTNLQDGTRTDAPSGKFILSFNKNMTVSSATDCNRISATYTQNSGLIQFSPFVSTRMFCEHSLETVYIGYLGKATSYYIVENEMRFNLNNDEGVMIFKKKI